MEQDSGSQPWNNAEVLGPQGTPGSVTDPASSRSARVLIAGVRENRVELPEPGQFGPHTLDDQDCLDGASLR